MDVFSLLKFWRNTGGGDFDSTIDDEESFFDLLLTNSGDENVFDYGSSPKLAGINSGVDDSNSSFRFAPPCDVYLNNKRKIVHLDSPNRKTPHSPLRLWMLGFQNNHKVDVGVEKKTITVGKRDSKTGNEKSTKVAIPIMLSQPIIKNKISLN